MPNPFGPGKLNEKDFTYSGFAGLRNNVDPARFDLHDLDAALNVDLDDTGRVMMRRGYTLAQAGSYHSLGPSNYPRCFVVSGTTLYELKADLSLTSRVTGLTPNARIAWFVSKDRYYWTNGEQSGCIDPSGARSWGLTVPPRIAGTVIGGALMLGKEDIDTARYQFSITYLRIDNQESGAPGSNYLDVPNNGGILFSNLPVSDDPTVDRKAVYISEPNGEKLFRAAVLPNATTTFAYQSRAHPTLPLATQFLGPPPSGAVISLQGGSILIAEGNRLHYSEPFAFELFDRRKVIRFPSAIQVVCSFDNGTHVATEDQHIWLAGDTPDKYEWNTAANYGAIAGTIDIVDADISMFGNADILGPVGIWASKEGIVKATADGKIENLTRARFLYPVQPRGAGLMRINRGMNQFMVVLEGDETAAPSYS